MRDECLTALGCCPNFVLFSINYQIHSVRDHVFLSGLVVAEAFVKPAKVRLFEYRFDFPTGAAVDTFDLADCCLAEAVSAKFRHDEDGGYALRHVGIFIIDHTDSSHGFAVSLDKIEKCGRLIQPSDGFLNRLGSGVGRPVAIFLIQIGKSLDLHLPNFFGVGKRGRAEYDVHKISPLQSLRRSKCRGGGAR